MFFAGGIVAVLGRGRFTFGQFFEPARRNFWHNAKCFFLFAVLLAVVLGALLRRCMRRGKKLFEDVPPDATRPCGVEVGARRSRGSPLGAGLAPLRLRPRGAALLSVDRRLARLGVRAARAPGLLAAAALALLLFWLVAGGAVWLGLLRRGLVDAGRVAARDRRALPPPVPRSLACARRCASRPGAPTSSFSTSARNAPSPPPRRCGPSRSRSQPPRPPPFSERRPAG